MVSLLQTLMDKSEAQKVLSEHLARFSQRSYSELVPMVESSHVEHCEIHGASGTKYQIEVQFFWDDKPGGVVHVSGSIDDGGIRAFFPLTQSLLVSKTESVMT
jgi:predicted methyltransferase